MIVQHFDGGTPRSMAVFLVPRLRSLMGEHRNFDLSTGL